ncbi:MULTISPECIES: heme exporter protein CcmD [unclassified Microbulbifer]|uniref:heme exporter protein CcmD n=1 Tax=unclassified Microbulbifer TaxID=2619833 RepID=UPI0027E4DA47|nr:MULTISPECIES: heme exporter protein CcmD [unclassified Microbulbifer]
MQFQFSGLADFLAMDGHGVYVWFCYGVTLLVLAGLAIQPALHRRRLQRELQRQRRIAEARRKRSENIAAEPV